MQTLPRSSTDAQSHLGMPSRRNKVTKNGNGPSEGLLYSPDAPRIAEAELVLSLIRQQFWIPHGKSAVKKELRNCIDCFKLVAKPVSQMMGDLPIELINPCRAFEKVGIDFAGPITTKCQHTRKANNFKSYIFLFICMCIKAVHLELVSWLTAAAFLSALRRFVSRRGYPSDIYYLF
ncbi:integrase catalytic domain-containing protein [Trichonephila clavipes]|nr:integrase catalytic domain-containing protein [Trichonephila clavipes]